ncbi:MAG: S1/P1 nuclease [Sphingobium sp.]|nr:S1/P1 nuclease [Sphingobium sp.]MBP9159128.1 S1/P1 nuclease [Sphingobium sp.]
MRAWLWMFVVVGLTTVAMIRPEPAQAWGRYGHLTVCDLAYRNFTPATRDAVAALLQSRNGGVLVKGRGRMADRRYTSFNLGCLEEDALPRRHAEDHFINVARTVPAITGASCPPSGECILAGITRDLDILKDPARSREERAFALMALGHWVGDIHQPLHISYADDRGGNGIDAKLTGKCGTSPYRVENLHAVWDNCLLEAGIFERVRKRADFKKSWGPRVRTY